MNPIFRPYRGWDGFPQRSYGRLDGVEPIDLKQAEEAVFAFDVVDADWYNFSSGADFDIGDLAQISARIGAYWKILFGPPGQRPVSTPFDNMPVYRIDVTARRGDRLWGELAALQEGQWVEIALASIGTYPVDVYGGIVAVAVEAHLISLMTLRGPLETTLSALFSVDSWPDAADEDLRAALSIGAAPEQLAVYDVGQGGAASLMDGGNTALLFFDLGAGSYGNSKTRPNPLRFCWRVDPPIVLSHWDTDHWAGEHTDPAAQMRTWIAPKQPNLGPTHHLFAARILAASGNLLIWGAAKGSSLSISFANGTSFRLGLCTGSSRNGSGIACVVDCATEAASWFLTGDAGYAEIALVPSFDLIGIIVPHHGADMTHLGSAPAKPHSGYCRLFYSFGPDNKHGRTSVTHPTSVAMTDHQTQGWNHGSWSGAAKVATSVAGGDVLATAENTGGHAGPRHLECAVMGWSIPPTVPLHGLPCSTHGISGGCTTDVCQA